MPDSERPKGKDFQFFVLLGLAAIAFSALIPANTIAIELVNRVMQLAGTGFLVEAALRLRGTSLMEKIAHRISFRY